MLVLLMSYGFWEFFTPFNQLGEPVRLIAIELIFWSIVAAVERFTIAALFESVPPSDRCRSTGCTAQRTCRSTRNSNECSVNPELWDRNPACDVQGSRIRRLEAYATETQPMNQGLTAHESDFAATECGGWCVANRTLDGSNFPKSIHRAGKSRCLRRHYDTDRHRKRRMANQILRLPNAAARDPSEIDKPPA